MKLASALLFLVGTLALPIAAIFLVDAGAPPSTGAATEKRFPPLKVPPGFKATLFACDPLIEYPSVISIGPKPGAIFVAIDYMTGLGLDHVRRDEIRLVEDTDGDGYADKATVFAKGFNSIQGMAYHDGTLYVMHAPFLTALRDTKKTGVADERQDLLTGLGLTPENNKVLLHCANGVTIGHDGWLYLALGDNGVNVPRPEGDRLILNGGGILRCRPDGRDLHVFATGLRNIYDIALDAELNVFVRDNENDGGTYMIRVCHSFFGADHGYPFLYDQRPDEALPPIGDFGLGSSAGGVCYLERQFPPEYRGNLFFCEWGKSVVRYPLQRAGTGFASVKEAVFALGDSKDTYPFKPTDIVVQRDGTLMVSDWCDGQRPKRGRGRIYHLAYVGQDSDPVKRTTGLDSESYYERVDAQAALKHGGKKPAIDPLGPRGRMHAIWVLASADGAKAIDALIRIAKSDPEPSVRAQAIRAIADLADPVLVEHKLDAGRGDVKLAEQLATLATGQDPRVMLEIMIALGRLRWAGAPNWLRQNLHQPDAPLAHAAMQTLRRCDNWTAVLKLLDEPDKTPIRKIAIRAIAERYDPVVVDGIIARLSIEKDATRRREFADALTRVYKKPGPWKYWGYRPGPKPASTQAWQHTDAIGAALDLMLADRDYDVRLAVLQRMMREKVPVRNARLVEWLDKDHQPQRVAGLLSALGSQAGPQESPAFRSVVLDAGHSDANRLAALDLFVKNAAEAAVPNGLRLFVKELEAGPVLAEALRRYGKSAQKDTALVAAWLRAPAAQVRAAAIEALGDMNAKEGIAASLQMLGDEDVRVRRAAVAVAGKLNVKAAVEPLLKLAADTDLGVRASCLESLRRLREPRVVPLAAAALNERALEAAALRALSELGGPGQLKAVADFAKRGASIEGANAAVRVLTAWRDQATPTMQKELDRAVAEIHGASGILVRWHVDPATPLFAVGAEARLTVPGQYVNQSLWCVVAVPSAMPVEFLASSRGPLEVWLNGQRIHQRAAGAKYQLDSDRFPAALQAGVNRVQIEGGSVEFHLHFRKKSVKAEHEKLTQAALTRAGNAERGRKIFFDKEKSQCLKCHRVGTDGERIGPVLTGVGSRFSRIYLVESILEPSRTIAPSFGTWIVSLKNGKTFNGVKIAETETILTLADNQGQKHVLAKADIEEQQPSPVSTMPDGLEQRFSADEFVDLIAFLMSLKESRN